MSGQCKGSLDQLFDLFLAARNQEDALSIFQEIKLQVSPLGHRRSIDLYSHLKHHLTSWRAVSIWKILDAQVKHKVYEKQVCAENKMCLVIGGGPIGLRCAVECALLGSEAHIIEKRTSVTRNNILHLWPFTIEDLRRLAAKKFYGQFCAGAIDHISIRQLQIILLKVCCVLGVHIHVGVEFSGLEEPSGDGRGWGINVSPHPGALPRFGWDVIMQASGTAHVLPLFQYKECRGQQAIGMTCNFVNRGTMEELTIEEISGIAFQFNQEFFNEMYVETGIALENIVYYKNETHYFVMSTKKLSLLAKGALKKDYPTTSELLSPDNIDYIKAQEFAREVAGFATNLPVLEFMKNHHDKADVAIFDFSAIKVASNSAMVVERQDKKLLMCLAGDSLLEPFWPQGTGCARGFLSAMNSAWMTKKFLRGDPVYDLLRERESLFRLLPQCSPAKLSQKLEKYTIDPSSRYRVWTVTAEQYEVFHLYNKGDTPIKNPALSMTQRNNMADIKAKRKPRQYRRKTVAVSNITRTTPEPTTPVTPTTPTTPTSSVEQGALLNWARESTCGYAGVRVSNLTTAWKSGLAFCALIHRYRPDLINFSQIAKYKPEQALSAAFDVTAKELGVKSLFTAKELASASIPDRQKIIYYLSALNSHFNSEASKCLQISPDMCYFCTRHISPDQLTSSHNIKFHLSCLKCEHCLDKMSVHTLHYVNDKTAEEYDKMRKPEFGHLKSGFYCKFHFKEFFTPNNQTLVKEHQEREIEYIGVDPPSFGTPPSTTPKENGFIHSESLDTDDVNIVMESDLRRAKSVSSVRNLRDMFENISTGVIEPEVKDDIKPQNIFEKMMNLPRKEPNPKVETITKSKSLYNLPRPTSQDITARSHEVTPEVIKSPLLRTPQRRSNMIERTNSHRLSGEFHRSSVELRISPNNPPVKYKDPEPPINKASSKFSINLSNLKYENGSSKKKKSGIAKKIDRKKSEANINRDVEATNLIKSKETFSSTASIDLATLKYSASSPCLGETIASQASHDDLPVHDYDDATDSPQYLNDSLVLKKKSRLNFFNRNKKPAVYERTTSLTFTNATSPLPDLPKPQFIEQEFIEPEFIESEFIESDDLDGGMQFMRNSFERATAPPNMSAEMSDAMDEVIDSSLCRRPSTAAVNLSREAVVIKSDSPQARSLLRNSIRNSKRYGAPGKESPLVNENPVFVDTVTKDSSPTCVTKDSPPTSSFKEITPQSPIIGERISLMTATPEKVLKKSIQKETAEDHSFISKTICSPKMKRAERVNIKDEPNKRKSTGSLTALETKKLISSLTTLEIPEKSPVKIQTDNSDIVQTIYSPKLKRAEMVNAVPMRQKKSSSDRDKKVQRRHSMDLPKHRERVITVDSNKLEVDENVITKSLLSPKLNRPERIIMKAPAEDKENSQPNSTSTASLSSASTSSTGTFTTSDVNDTFLSPGQLRKPLKWTTPQSSSQTNSSSISDVFYTPETATPFLLKYTDKDKTDILSISSSLASVSINLSDTEDSASDSNRLLTSSSSVEIVQRKPFMYAKSSPNELKPSIKSVPKQVKQELDEIDKTLSKLESPVKPPRTSLKRTTTTFGTPTTKVTPAAGAVATMAKYSRAASVNSPKSTTSPRSSPQTQKVLSRNSTAAEEASINHILQKYRKPQSKEAEAPPLPTRNSSYKPNTRSDNEKPDTRCTRDIARSVSNKHPVAGEKSQETPKTPGRPTPRNRIKMISQLSASFDKSIDRLVHKYHRKGKTSPDPVAAKLDFKKDEDYESLKDSNIPSETTSDTSSISDNRSLRRGSTRDSTRSKTSIPIDPSLLQYDRNSSFKEKSTPQKSTPSRQPPARSASTYNTPPRPQVERQQSMPQRYTNANNTQYKPSPRSANKSVDKRNKRGSKEGTEYIQNTEDRGDKADYLKSLYYMYSSSTPISNRVENKFVFPQRKSTDV